MGGFYSSGSYESDESFVFVRVCRRVLAWKWWNSSQQNKQDTKHTHTHLCLRFYSTETGKTKHASPLLLSTSMLPKPPWQQPVSQKKPCDFSLVAIETDPVVSTRSEQGESINLSINLQKCTCDFNAHLQTRQVYSPRTHALTQTIHYIKCFKKYR